MNTLLRNVLTLLAVLGGLGAMLLLTMPAIGRPTGEPVAALQDQPAIVINEILAHTDAPSVDAVELYNTGDAADEIRAGMEGLLNGFHPTNDAAYNVIRDTARILKLDLGKMK